MERALDALMARRNPAGYWEGRLASSPLATAVALCALADDGEAGIDRAAAFEYLRRTQHADGGWGDTETSRSNLAATILTLCADSTFTNDDLRLTIEQQSHGCNRQSSIVNRQSFLSEHARISAEAYFRKLGGLKEGLARVYGADLTFQVPLRMTAAFSGLRTQDSGFRATAGAKSQEPRAESLSEWRSVDALPFELALAPRWAMGALRLPVVSYALPALVCVGLSRHAKAPSRFPPLRWLREWCAERALKLIEKMQPASGGYLEAIPITAFCLIGLKAAGRAEHPVARNARRFLLSTQRADGSWPVEVHLSVWNTTRAIDALAASGLLYQALTDSERTATCEWLLAQQSKSGHVYTDTRPGGWGWNHLDGSVPDADDTSGAVIALRHLGMDPAHPALIAARDWLLSVQNADGGWPTFCRGWQKLPFDRSAPDLTAHALRALQALDEKQRPEYLAGWEYLKRAQRPDGSFAPLWFGCEIASDQANATYGTVHVILACQRGEPIAEKIRDRALDWLRKIQNPDGGFGGCKGAPSTAEETGLALRAFARCGGPPKGALEWLHARQCANGSWDPAPIGFYFAVLWYHEELYPLYYALGGLGAIAGDPSPTHREAVHQTVA